MTIESDLSDHFARLDAELDDVIEAFPDNSEISQQALMELFTRNIENLQHIKGVKGETALISDWEGLTFNDSGKVIAINWDFCLLKGSLDAKWLPATVEKLCVSGNFLSDEFDFSSLPSSLKELNLSSNTLTGSDFLHMLPPHLETLFLEDNAFDGLLNLENLPESLRVLNIGKNAFSGNLAFGALPASIVWLSLSENDIDGVLDLRCLPKNLKSLHVDGNRLDGLTDFSDLPADLQYLNIAGNTGLTGDLYVKKNESRWYQGELKTVVHDTGVRIVYDE